MKVAVIGCGNMGSAIIGGLIRSGAVRPGDLTASDKSGEMRKKAETAFGIRTTDDNADCISGADLIVAAVKPNVFTAALSEISSVLLKHQIILSIAAGKTMADLEKVFGGDKKLVRAMPNTPALVGEGITGFCVSPNITEDDKKLVLTVLSSFGEAEEVPESLMAAVTSVSGSSPAYVYIFIEAMADAAVADGMPRKQAYHFAAKTVLGSAKMVLETGKHPGELKDMVCSPGGTTIEGVAALEKAGFRTSVIEAVRACTKKAKDMQG